MAFRLMSWIVVWTVWKRLYAILWVLLIYASLALGLFLWMEWLAILRSQVKGTYGTDDWAPFLAALSLGLSFERRSRTLEAEGFVLDFFWFYS